MGERLGSMQAACTALVAKGCQLQRSSSIYETAPWGMVDQPAFLNAVIQVDFEGSPADLLEIALETEAELGRKRLAHWGPRSIDIDILAFGELEITSQRLTIPHPMLSQRAFVLIPWAEIAADFVIPGQNETVEALLAALPETDLNGIEKTDLQLSPF